MATPMDMVGGTFILAKHNRNQVGFRGSIILPGKKWRLHCLPLYMGPNMCGGVLLLDVV